MLCTVGKFLVVGAMRFILCDVPLCSGSDSDDSRLTQLQAVFAVKDVLPPKR